jgi:hypothetical protein
MYPEHIDKKGGKRVTNSTKFVRTKQRLLNIFRPTSPPTPETPARTTPDEIQRDEDPAKFGVRVPGEA